MPQSNTCCTCANFLRDTKIPRDHKSEKPLAFDRHLECCQRIICASCQYKNPRFQTYCPFCQISTEPTALPQNGLRLPPAYSKTNTKPGSKPDEETSLRTQLAANTEYDAPPPYTATPQSSAPLSSHHSNTPSTAITSTDDHNHPATTEDTTHHLSPNDTLSSLSLAYAVPVPVLQAHNNLYSASLLAGRKTISIPATHYRGPPLSNPPDPVEERRKVRVRRWMVATKCADYRVAELYLKGVGDMAATAADDGLVGTNGEVEEDEDDRIVKVAVERFKADEEWERRNPLEKEKKMKGKRRSGAGGSLAGQLF